MLIFTELGEDLTLLAHKEITQSDIFLWDSVDPLEPHKLLKNLGALSE
jgi:hypothetical protein